VDARRYRNLFVGPPVETSPEATATATEGADGSADGRAPVQAEAAPEPEDRSARVRVEVLRPLGGNPAEYGCWLERSFGVRDAAWNCASRYANDWVDRCAGQFGGMPDPGGPAFPPEAVAKLGAGVTSAGVAWSYGRIRNARFCFEPHVTIADARAALGLGRKPPLMTQGPDGWVHDVGEFQILSRPKGGCIVLEVRLYHPEPGTCARYRAERPHGALQHYRLGTALVGMNAGDSVGATPEALREAVAELQAALRKGYPDVLAVHQQLVLAYGSLGEEREAERARQVVRKIDPEKAALDDAGAEENPSRRVEFLQRFVRTHPRAALALEALGFARLAVAESADGAHRKRLENAAVLDLQNAARQYTHEQARNRGPWLVDIVRRLKGPGPAAQLEATLPPFAWRAPARADLEGPWRSADPTGFTVVHGDFDGDGRPDEARLVVADGEDYYAVVVTFSDGREQVAFRATPGAETVERKGLRVRRAGTYHGKCHIEPGTCEGHDTPVTVAIPHDGLELIDHGSTHGQLFHWSDRDRAFKWFYVPSDELRPHR
jgi:hypothetical protein